MQHALRRAAAMVAAMATLGCTGDYPSAPETVWPKATLAESSTAHTVETTSSAEATSVVAPANADSDTRAPVLVAAAPPPAVLPAAPLERSSTGANRYSREQSLGFQNGVLSEPCLDEGASMGAWELRFSGYGCVGLTAGENGTALSMQPMVATAGDETHAPLLLGPQFGDRLMMSARVETVQQLRKNGEPNAWEVAWLLWQYQDDDHFYYFIPKPNGWEIGKRDPAYPGGQRFLATGTDQKFPVGRTYNVQITHKGNVFSVVVDGVALASFTDNERPYVSGRIALYSEDAEVKVHQVSVRTGAF